MSFWNHFRSRCLQNICVFKKVSCLNVWQPNLTIYFKITTLMHINGHLELTLLKVRQRFDAISTANVEVYKFRDWWILTYFIFGLGEFSPNNIWSTVSLERTFVLLFYYFLCLKTNLDLEKNQINLVNLHPTLFSRWWTLIQFFFWKRGELMVNPDLTILLKRWTEVKTWGGQVQDALWRMHKISVIDLMAHFCAIRCFSGDI